MSEEAKENIEVELNVEDDKPKEVKPRKIYKVLPYKCIKCGKKTTSSNPDIAKQGICKPCKAFENVQKAKLSDIPDKRSLSEDMQKEGK